MPLYIYECKSCKARKERLRSADDRLKPLRCPGCGGEMRHVLANVNWSRAKGWGIYGNRPGYGKED